MSLIYRGESLSFVYPLHLFGVFFRLIQLIFCLLQFSITYLNLLEVTRKRSAIGVERDSLKGLFVPVKLKIEDVDLSQVDSVGMNPNRFGSSKYTKGGKNTVFKFHL